VGGDSGSGSAFFFPLPFGRPTGRFSGLKSRVACVVLFLLPFGRPTGRFAGDPVSCPPVTGVGIVSEMPEFEAGGSASAEAADKSVMPPAMLEKLWLAAVAIFLRTT
jgi:hypothetical protein